MARKPHGGKKRLSTLAKKTSEQKLALLEHLAKCCIVQFACERAGVGRSTYYKWYVEDKEFKELADKSINAGRAYLNDIAFSGLLKKIQEGNMTGLIFWLKNNHAWFAERIRHEHHLVADKALTPEQREQITKALRLSGLASTFINHEKLAQRFLESPKGDPEPDTVQNVTPPEMSDEERVSDWGTSKPRERLMNELKREGVNIEEFLKKYRKN